MLEFNFRISENATIRRAHQGATKIRSAHNFCPAGASSHALPIHSPKMNQTPEPEAKSQPHLKIYFDGACPVCSREIAYYRGQRGANACEWIDASSCDEALLGPDLSREAALARFHVRRADGELVDGMRGFATLWQALPRTAWLGRIASFGLMPVLLDRAYAVFLGVRKLWRRGTIG